MRKPYPADYTNKAIILDYDGTLRETISGNLWPETPEDIRILPNRYEVLTKRKNEGYLLLGVSNQSMISKGNFTFEQAVAMFKRTNELLDMDIDVRFCPHPSVPVQCYCRKPGPGLGVELIHQYKLDPSKCIMVGDMTSDKTFAKRCGFNYVDQEIFFK